MKFQRITALFGALAAIAILAVSSGCNTTEGLGQDIEDAGEGIQDAAN